MEEEISEKTEVVSQQIVKPMYSTQQIESSKYESTNSSLESVNESHQEHEEHQDRVETLQINTRVAFNLEVDSGMHETLDSKSNREANVGRQERDIFGASSKEAVLERKGQIASTIQQETRQLEQTAMPGKMLLFKSRSMSMRNSNQNQLNDVVLGANLIHRVGEPTSVNPKFEEWDRNILGKPPEELDRELGDQTLCTTVVPKVAFKAFEKMPNEKIRVNLKLGSILCGGLSEKVTKFANSSHVQINESQGSSGRSSFGKSNFKAGMNSFPKLEIPVFEGSQSMNWIRNHVDYFTANFDVWQQRDSMQLVMFWKELCVDRCVALKCFLIQQDDISGNVLKEVVYAKLNGKQGALFQNLDVRWKEFSETSKKLSLDAYNLFDDMPVEEWSEKLQDNCSLGLTKEFVSPKRENEVQRIKQELVTDTKNQALVYIDKATKIAEIHAEKVDITSAELVRLKTEASKNADIMEAIQDPLMMPYDKGRKTLMPSGEHEEINFWIVLSGSVVKLDTHTPRPKTLLDPDIDDFVELLSMFRGFFKSIECNSSFTFDPMGRDDSLVDSLDIFAEYMSHVSLEIILMIPFDRGKLQTVHCCSLCKDFCWKMHTNRRFKVKLGSASATYMVRLQWKSTRVVKLALLISFVEDYASATVVYGAKIFVMAYFTVLAEVLMEVMFASVGFAYIGSCKTLSHHVGFEGEC